SGNLLLNAAANKGSAQNRPGGQQGGQQGGPQSGQQPPAQQQPTPAAAPPSGAGQSAAAASTLAATQASANAAATSGANAGRISQGSTFGDAITSAAGPATGPGSIARAAPAAPKPPASPTAQSRATTDQIAVQIRKAVDQGNDKIRIQLRPAELGRVEIKLDIGADGRVMASVTAERPETMELLQRDARGLQQALQDAGLQADSNSLSFSLNGDNAEDQPSENARNGENNQSEETLSATADDRDAPRRAADGLIDVEV
ncbi:MAG: flagellar hook-length control protein FliK, partial [Alphaproteobacteria bacterium]|nr:flagellar hook-length control protein FliK [Alphaproteobacteria bacterium]